MPEPIYCDQAATSFPKPPEVIEAVKKAMESVSASPGRSGHAFALAASRTVFEAREAVADFLGADDSSRIIFTLNVTQAINTALNGFLGPGDHVLTSALEHNSVMRPLTFLAASRDVKVEIAPASPDGRMDPDDFRKRITPRTRLVVVNHASNVIGHIAPIREIKAVLDGIPLLLDTAQSAGALNLAPCAELADMVAFTGHKGLMGPTGTGGLWVRPGLSINPLMRGGTGSRSEREEHPDFMPDALEAGTPNTHGLAGLAAALNFVMAVGPENIAGHERALVKKFMAGLSGIKGATVYGPGDPENKTAVVSINLKGWSPSDLAGTLDRDYGIMTRPGLHCAPRAHQTIGSFPRGTVRFSFGWFNNLEEVDRVLAALHALSGQNG